jgi:hypothetical protein
MVFLPTYECGYQRYLADRERCTDRYARGLSPDGNDSDFNKSEDYDGIIDFHEKPKKVGRPLGRLSEDKYAPSKYNTSPYFSISSRMILLSSPKVLLTDAT